MATAAGLARNEGGNAVGHGSTVAKSKAKRRVQFYGMLAASDLAAVLTGFSAAAYMPFSQPGQTTLPAAISSFAILFLIIATQRGAFGIGTLQHWTRGLRRSLSALGLSALTILAIAFAWKVSSDYSRLFVLFGVLFSGSLLILSRWAMSGMAERAFPGGPVDEIVLYEGRPSHCAPHQRAIDIHALALTPRLDCPDTLDQIGRLVGDADRVVVDCSLEDRQAWTAALKGLGIRVEVLVPEVEKLGVLEINRHGACPSAVVATGSLSLRQRVTKRMFDLAAVLWLLPALVLITAVVALLIKLDDGGPIFFVQKRIGKGNRLFSIYKFRSMRVERADATGSRSASRDDDRITRIGRILRSTSLDELPQLFNVLKGDMSIVGPRPHAVASTAANQLFWDVDRRYFFRHAAKPGLTGLAQVRGFRGATETRDDLINRVQADLEYLSGWSLWRDIRILAATVKVVVHSNAY